MIEGNYSGKADDATAAVASAAGTAVEDTAVRLEPSGGFAIPEDRGPAEENMFREISSEKSRPRKAFQTC